MSLLGQIVRSSETKCAAAQTYCTPRRALFQLMSHSKLSGVQTFIRIEQPVPGQPKAIAIYIIYYISV